MRTLVSGDLGRSRVSNSSQANPALSRNFALASRTILREHRDREAQFACPSSARL